MLLLLLLLMVVVMLLLQLLLVMMAQVGVRRLLLRGQTVHGDDAARFNDVIVLSGRLDRLDVAVAVTVTVERFLFSTFSSAAILEPDLHLNSRNDH